MKTTYAENMFYGLELPFIFHRRVEKSQTIVSTIADWHEHLELQFCLDGRGEIIINSEENFFSKGMTVVVNSEVIHHTESSGYILYSCLIIDAEFCRLLGIDVGTTVFETVIQDERLTELAYQFESIYTVKDDICRRAKLCKCAAEMLILLREKYTVSENKKKENDKSYETAKKAIAYIREHYTEKISLDDIAKNIYVSKFTLSRDFKAAAGRSVVEYINMYRCKCAAKLISDGTSVYSAAEKCGFTNSSFFARTFVKYMKKLPSQFKKMD